MTLPKMKDVSQIDWLIPRYDTIPELLKQHARWKFWTLDGEGKKVARKATEQKDRNIDANKSSNWSNWDQIIAASQKYNGPAFSLGSVDNGPTFPGIDLDGCRNPETGVIDGWAWSVIRSINSYTEISPSRRGVKIFLTGALPEDAPQGKVFKLEIYDRKRYFTVTGHHLPGTPTTVEPREAELRELYARQRSTDIVELAKLFGFFKQDRGEWVDIICPWADEHSTPDGTTDVSLHRGADGEIDVFKCLHASHDGKKTLADIRKLFQLKGSHSGFICNKNGNIIADNQENIRRAWDKLGISLSHNVFALTMFATQSNVTKQLDDAVLDRSWFLIDEEFHFKPSSQYYERLMYDTARGRPFHPVLDYLNGLRWDGVPRIDLWLTTYGQAKDTKLNRAFAAKTLIAAVKRVKQPGCKKDELLILIGPKQGTLKSTSIRTLCPDEAWFSDDLPLNVDSKELIERTSGKWLIEVSDLQGYSDRQLEKLKASLSRQTDGPVRLAYAHIPEQVPRQHLAIGTTNKRAFLKDATGNRRFWPVEVVQLDIAALRRDRDQLWAEAVVRLAGGESIELDPSLWDAAAKQQQLRQIDDAWVEVLRDHLNLNTDKPSDRVLVEDIWMALGIAAEHRSKQANDRLHDTMQALGYVKKHARGIKSDDPLSAMVKTRWCLVAGQGELDEES